MKFSAKIVTSEEASRQLAEFNEKRKRPLVVEKSRDYGTVFYEDVEGGRRKFDRVHVTYVRSFENRVLQFIGGLFIFAGILGFFMEWRLRKLQTP